MGRRACARSPGSNAPHVPNQHFLPVTDQVVRWHLSGHDDSGRDFVMGVYPLLRDETCFFLAADLDKAQWQEDAQAILETCRRLDLAAALERSRSGNGGHIWLFFEQAIPATLARKLGAHLLTETMERRPGIGLDSYDRFFPNQDTLPQGGFGNLIALPLQKRPRELGNSVFLDDGHRASRRPMGVPVEHPQDRSSQRRANRCRSGKDGDALSACGSRPSDEDAAAPWAAPPSRRRTEPPLAGPLPERLELILGDQIYIAKDPLPPGLYNRLVRLAAFQNPEFYKAQAMRLPTYDKPRIIACAEDLPQHIGLPRGCLDEVRELLSDLRIDVVIRDERNAGKPSGREIPGRVVPRASDGRPRPAWPTTPAFLSATTAFGKTVVAAWLIAERGVNTLVLVHRRQLQEQWVERLSAFLGLPPKSHRPNRGRTKEAHGVTGCGDHPKPGAQERGE